MFGVILKATNSSFQNGMIFCRSIYVKKVMKLLAFIFEQPSYFMKFNAIIFSKPLNICIPQSRSEETKTTQHLMIFIVIKPLHCGRIPFFFTQPNKALRNHFLKLISALFHIIVPSSVGPST